MGGLLLWMGFLFSGCMLASALPRRLSGLHRLWLGLTAGMMEMMWFPAVLAFPMRFTRAANLLSLGIALALGGVVLWKNRDAWRGDFLPDGLPRWLIPSLLVPALLLTGYLFYTHYFRPVGGTLHVGQSTYGDINMHAGIATSLRNAAFPMDYTLLKGNILGYPFLADSMVTSMLLFGTDLEAAFVSTGILMMALVFLGTVLLTWQLTQRPAAVVITFVLLFLNGGLGFLYTFDGVMRDSSALYAVFHDFYKAPANQPDLNLRWVNLICDMFIPQRTFLCGWMVLLPAVWLLVTALRENRMAPWVLLGVWSGLMPMVHTHSFLALGMLSAGVMAHQLIHAQRGQKFAVLRRFAVFGVLAVLLALPQLMIWTFPQTFHGSTLKLLFNWVNNQGNGRLIDEYFWFWIKNVGPVYVLIVPAVLSRKRGSALRALGLGALAIYLVAENVIFQRLVYDNNKLFYVAYLLVLPSVAEWLADCWHALRGIRGRALLAACFAVICTISGGLSLAREVVSDYELFGSAEVAAAEFIDENTPEHSMFLTGQQHNNAVAVLTGRYIVCGAANFLYTHGMDYSRQQQAACAMLEDPENSGDLFEEYGVDYVYISSHERANFAVDEAWFRANGLLVFEQGNVAVFALSDAARAFPAQS